VRSGEKIRSTHFYGMKRRDCISPITLTEASTIASPFLPLIILCGPASPQKSRQRDSPFGWAPLHYIVVMGLLRYGYEAEAKRIAEKFCAVVEKEYRRTGHMFEKYDVIKGTADVHLDFGYESNEPGFGWTNAVYLLFRHRLNKMAADESRNR